MGNATTAVNQTIAGLTTAGTGTSVVANGGNATASTLNINSSGPDTYAGVLGGAGTNQNLLNLTLTGSGTLTLSGSNTFSGVTSINAGALQLSNVSAAQNSIVAINAGTGTTGTNNGLLFTSGLGDAFTIGGLSGSSNEALLDTAGNAVALTVGNGNDTGMNYSGILSGSGSLIKTGTGTQTLSGREQLHRHDLGHWWRSEHREQHRLGHRRGRHHGVQRRDVGIPEWYHR